MHSLACRREAALKYDKCCECPTNQAYTPNTPFIFVSIESPHRVLAQDGGRKRLNWRLMTLSTLYKMAQEYNIVNRSKMTKNELMESVKKTIRAK